MYVWIWRHLPGPTTVRILQVLVLFLLVVALLFFVVFPWLEQYLPFDRVTDPQTRRLKSAEELRRLFGEAGVRLDGPIVTSCGSGVTACAVAFAAHLLGHPGAAVYDGSWSEWGLPDGPPIETGPARK